MIKILTADYFDALRDTLAYAREHVRVLAYVINFNFYQKYYRSTYIFNRLLDLHRAAVPVDIILDSSPNYSNNHRANLFTVTRFAEKGIKIRMQTDKHPQHSKLIIIDQATAFLGSHNLTEGSLSNKNELSFQITDPPTVRELSTYFDSLWSGPLTLPWERRFWPKSKASQYRQQSQPITPPRK
jgi:phosphatidylserine/phosphatidylglycerophosphate/cardiolipin synthase-like enzyme